MVREEADSSGVSASSIALLQERFRQLQRMKELRQERELMRSLSESERCGHAPQMIHTNRRPRHKAASPAPAPARPHCQLALSLWPDSQAKSWAPSDLAKPSYHSPTCQFTRFNLDNSDSDIDTSLRL